MEAGDRTIRACLEKNGYPATAWNILTIRDGLQWETREEHETVKDAIDSVIEDCEPTLRRACW